MIQLNDIDLAQINGGTKIPYRVQKGDTLGALAARFNVSIEDICKWNNITDPNKIVEDQLLIFKY